MNTDIYLLVVMLSTAFIVLFPIEAKNLFIMLKSRKDYVVCHVFRTATRKPVTIYAVPDVKSGYQTRIWKKKTYNLNPEHVNFVENGRLHFIFLEESNVPLKADRIQNLNPGEIIFTYNGKVYLNTDEQATQLKFEPWTKNDVLIFSDEVDTGINAKSHNVLHGDQSHIALILALIAVLVAVGTAIYVNSTVQDISPLIHVIYEKVQPANITINGR